MSFIITCIKTSFGLKVKLERNIMMNFKLVFCFYCKAEVDLVTQSAFQLMPGLMLFPDTQVGSHTLCSRNRFLLVVLKAGEGWPMFFFAGSPASSYG